MTTVVHIAGDSLSFMITLYINRMCIASAFFWGGREPWEKPPNMWLPSKERSHQKPIKREFPGKSWNIKSASWEGICDRFQEGDRTRFNILQSIDLWLPLFLRKMIWCRFGDDRFHETLCQRWFRKKNTCFSRNC